MTKKIINDKWTRELSQHIDWNPAEEGLEPHVDINKTKCSHVMKRWLVENGHEEWCEKTIGQTPYNVAKTHPLCNNMLLLTGYISWEEYKAITEKGVESGKKWYNYAIDDGEKFIEIMRDVSTQIHELRQTPQEIELGALKLEMPEEAKRIAVDALLTSSGLPDLKSLFDELGKTTEKISEAKAEQDKAVTAYGEQVDENERLRTEVTNLMSKATAIDSLEYTADKGDVPDGKVTTKKVKDLWTEITHDPKIAEMEVPVWEWDGEHPDVPKVDPNYIFRPQHLARALYAIVTNQREYIQGHTGSGKTTLVEQVAARLNWPFIRINFDSEITRMDLIGRDTLVSDSEGVVTSVFEDGMLPTAMSGPYICCFDELDFVRPDVAYVMQAALEGNGLRITEDGDRLVRPHPMFRMFGTGNTVGQGDEHGMYQGARPQSMAFLDRFTIWDQVHYLKADERKALVERSYPMLDTKEKNVILQYTTEHLEAFEQGHVIQPISPRGMLAICQATVMLGNVKMALEMSILDRANVEDRATFKGLIDRCVK